ncbi:MAG TPA: ABC transporter ATP-binding protein, partial [Pirellulales bacterium]|nr:ABC transporter ATP-binding protein [Pirellulales bacterium]
MSDEIIKVEGLGKKYTIGTAAPRESYTALRDVISRSARGLWHGARRALRGQTTIAPRHTEEFWALDDVSFDVRRGDVLGIIGRNGAGKSTLLKILSRITEPTAGRVTLRGRVASLLEVGTGFHPELTGRENIFLNGAILGMTRAEVKRKFDEIVAFAEVEKFLDTPVKRYSSGMFVRLAFAVAAHLEPEILVVDEVLAVGDAEFQKKCLGKMGEVAEAGRTVLFVSHNTTAMKNMCTHGILLNQGQVVCHADISSTVHQYSLLANNVVTIREWEEFNAPGTEGVKLLSARLVTAPPASPDNLTVADPFAFEFRYLVTDPEL